MKKIYISILLFSIVTMTEAQMKQEIVMKDRGTSVDSIECVTCPNIKCQDCPVMNTKFSYVTPRRDTLVLLNNEIGNLVANLWKQDNKYTGKRPVIIMTDDISGFLKKEDIQNNDLSAKKSGAVR
jgi:hypothetical protein